MAGQSEEKKVQFDEDKIVVLGPSFDFWLNEEDDVYDELYGEKKATTRDNIPDGRHLPGSTGE